jgi:CRISPR/Cas system CSM-associated protein Csm3 (group 7 of RAMP superfamily)
MQETKKLKMVLETIAPIRIGANRSALSTVDLAIVKIGGKYCIPGSSLKGALRNKLDEYFISLYKEKNKETLKPCIAASEASPSEEKLLRDCYKMFGCNFNEIENDYICPSCYFLGAQGIRGFVIVPILFTSDENIEKITGISIDRATKTARRGALYSYQIIPQGVKFEGIMEILIKDAVTGFEFGKPRKIGNITIDKWLEDLNDFRSTEKLLDILKKSLENINRLGGFISKGLGNVKIKVEEL